MANGEHEEEREFLAGLKARTGRDLVVSGSTSLTLFPRLAVAFANVSLSAPPGMRGEPTLRITSAQKSRSSPW